MFSITVETEFCAAHALVIAGAKEPLHGHNFHVWVTVEGPTLDADGLLCDFHAVERALRDVTGPLATRNLHETPAFSRVNPTAEHIARHIADEVGGRLAGVLPRGAGVSLVRVSEAPGCVALYVPQGTMEKPTT